MRTALAFIAVTIALGTTLGCAPGTRSPTQNTERDYRKLVEGLVSPNCPIWIVNGREYTTAISIPPDYDWKAQKRIDENRELLSAHLEEALPFLIEGCTDTRYSLSGRGDGDYVINSCVGWVCENIIVEPVEVFREFMRFSDPMEWQRYNFVPRLSITIDTHVTDEQKKEVQDWWQRRKDKSLRELQIEAFDWAIEKRTKEFEKYKERERPDDIDRLTAARDKLSRGTRYLPPRGHISWSILSPPKDLRVVPWTERQR